MKVVVPEIAEDFINQQIPLKVRASIVPIIRSSYSLAYQAVHNSDFLNWEIGHAHVGYLKPIAIQFMFKKAIDEGKLNLQYRLSYNKNKTARHLELLTNRAIITISQTRSPNRIARPAFFRKKYQELNLNQLFIDYFGEVNQYNILQEKRYLLLTHGYGNVEPDFIMLGIPGKKEWIDRINLLKEKHLVQNNDIQIEDDANMEERLVSFKRFVQGVQNE
ncbi:hypothetical protein LOK74_19005 [Brevibacillus humidisoli]|uniref:hypothetical protein n=1 Tax=Brevibacillus humidisoli TaxID=2895522 RepID=UPI001E409512|nr:hypothetical protein [Brevibacillus humidisoli]UFJ40103.1 hypothetical protein LOK74_19005 [Brevibacillus humidisoli]